MVIAFICNMKTLYFIIAAFISIGFISNLTAQNEYNSNGNSNNPINYNVAVNTDNSSEVQAEVQVQQIQVPQVQNQRDYNPNVPVQEVEQQRGVQVKRNPYKVTPGVYTGMSSGKSKKKKRKKSRFFKKLFTNSSFSRANPYKNCSHTRSCFLFS